MQNHRFEIISLPCAIHFAGGVAATNLSYDNKRQEVSLGDHMTNLLTWHMTPEEWESELAGWMTRGATEGADIYNNDEHEWSFVTKW
jgi:hypothetical protein